MGKLANRQDTDVRWEGEPYLVSPLRDWDPWGRLEAYNEYTRTQRALPQDLSGAAGEAAGWRHCQLPWCLSCYLLWELFPPLCLLSVAASSKQCGVVTPSGGQACWFTVLFIRDTLNTDVLTADDFGCVP